MPRTDENGRELQAVLSYMLNRAVPATELTVALEISRSSYDRRSGSAPDYPNAEECRLVGEHFGRNPLELMAIFGLVSPGQVFEVCDLLGGPSGKGGHGTATEVKKTTTRRKPKVTSKPTISDLVRRPEVPTL